MKISIKEIASLINGNVSGDINIEISNVAKIEEAKQGDLTFLYLPAYDKFFPATQASAIIVKTGFSKSRNDITYIEVDSPEKAFFTILKKFFTPEFPLNGIDPSAFIHPTAKLAENVAVGKNVVISSGCIIGADTKVFHNTVVSDNVSIGSGCLIHSNVSVRENCILGNRVIIHSGTVVGSDGFGYSPNEKGEYEKIPQIGNVIIEDDVELGSNVSIDRAALGSTIIKRGCKIDNLVQIAHNVILGEDTVVSAQTGVSGSTKIGKHCILAGQAGLVGHIELADNVIITAQSGVSKSIPKPGYYSGSPAMEMRSYQKMQAQVRFIPDYADRIKELENQVKSLKELISKK
ncbi:MAG: UDP-3-O-(3-hydroxymyristoyl)glucosamine N-acyltransferase [Ignavibacteriales bacterium]|nr:MAG: UDP-3-O-(3-hydroxymyristoyl)glucosamine N-acyltransferase [Ignavibacteriales bacterium]